MENKNKSLAHKIQENTNEVSCREKIESNNQGPTVGDADKVRKSSTVSFCEQTRSNVPSPTSRSRRKGNEQRVKRLRQDRKQPKTKKCLRRDNKPRVEGG